ncbi:MULTISPECIES: LacI family DNA-binding transcriptional regulator [unclassified Sinorhizobium]|uniref:LacI family DNA-binding transcriptional regulator n=1 Tax=unclassified Sinorhizobium TaxID=2613772 RepID=UPI003525E294
MKKTTLQDVAREAKLGIATVERVINSRGGVTEKTAEKVIRAAKKLGYGERSTEIYRGTIRIEVILVRPETSFFARLNQAFERIAASLDRSVILHRTFIKESDPIGMAHHIANPNFRRSGLIICSQDHPTVIESLRRVRASGVEVVQVVTRCDHPDVPYVGIDNYAAGRSAAYYMSGMLAARGGSLVAICHSGTYMNHRERIQGFSDYIAEKGASDHFLSLVMLGQDDDLQSAELLAEALRRDPDIIGVYSAGGGDEGVAIVLQQWARQRNIFWVGHELTEKKKRYLESGLMDICLDQAPEVQARRSVDMILRKLDVIRTEIITDPVRFMTVSAQNL